MLGPIILGIWLATYAWVWLWVFKSQCPNYRNERKFLEISCFSKAAWNKKYKNHRNEESSWKIPLF